MVKIFYMKYCSIASCREQGGILGLGYTSVAIKDTFMTEHRSDTDPSKSTTDIQQPLSVAHTARQSKGSKWGAIAGAVITMAFFMPWFRACNTDISGYDLASNRISGVDNAGLYWVVLLGGLACIALFFLLKTPDRASRMRSAWLRLVAGLAGGFPIFNIWLKVPEQPDAIDLLYGFWLVTLGYVGVIVSFFMDRQTKE